MYLPFSQYMRSISAIVTILALIIPMQSVHARPSGRAIQNSGIEQKQAEMKNRIKNIQDAIQQKYEWQDHPRGNGLSTMVPEDWDVYLPSKSLELEKYFAKDTVWYYLDHKEGTEFLGFGIRMLDHPATLDEADRLHDAFAKQPSNDHEFVNKSYLHDYAFISGETITVAGKKARAHTYSFISQSVHWEAVDVRVPDGNTMIVLLYQAPKNLFTIGKKHFNVFMDSLKIPSRKQSTAKSSNVIPAKKRRSTKSNIQKE